MIGADRYLALNVRHIIERLKSSRQFAPNIRYIKKEAHIVW